MQKYGSRKLEKEVKEYSRRINHFFHIRYKKTLHSRNLSGKIKNINGEINIAM